MGDVVVRGCLGLSDHEMIEFLTLGEVKREVSKITTMDLEGRLWPVQDAG